MSSTIFFTHENLYISPMKITPIPYLQLQHPTPPESKHTGMSPLNIKEGFVVFRISGPLPSHHTYGLLAYVFPTNPQSIRPHEQVLSKRLIEKKHEVLSAKMRNKPVALLYHSRDELTRLLVEGFYSGDRIATWTIDEHEYAYVVNAHPDWNREIAIALEKLDALVIADGHHRTYIYFERFYNQKKDYGLFSAIMPLEQIRIFAYHRVLLLDSELGVEFIHDLSKKYKMYDIGEQGGNIPESDGESLLFLHQKKWKKLIPIHDAHIPRPGSPDLLTQFESATLIPFCNIRDLNISEHWLYISALELPSTVERISDEEMVFVFPPVEPIFLWDSSIRGEVMPAKSTWIEPRMPSDLILVPNNYE